MRTRLKLALSFWRGVGCELCTVYRDDAAADTHDMEECRDWEEAPQAQRLLRLLEEMSVRARPDEDGSTGSAGNGSPCKACSFLSTHCGSDSPRLTARDGTVADCKNIEVARRAVAALLSFEDGVLADGLYKAEWVMTDDPAAMQMWMAEQKLTDRRYFHVPRIVRALDHLFGSYGYLLANYEYRAELRPFRKKQDTVVAVPPRYSDEPVGLLIDSMDAELLDKEGRLNRVKEMIQESEGAAQRPEDSRYTTQHLRNLQDRLQSHIKPIRDMKLICLSLKEIERRLFRFRDVCMVCRAMEKPSNHNIRVCTNEMAQKARAE